MFKVSKLLAVNVLVFFVIINGELQKGIASPNPRWTVSGDCVTDNQTKLIWSKDANMWGEETNWQNALDRIALLNQQGGLCGFTDWRLPNIKELESVIDKSNHYPSLPTGHPFSNVELSFYSYWSSTTYGHTSPSAWIVHMYRGYMTGLNKTFSCYVWPVRSGP